MFVGNGLANVRRMSPPSRVIDETAVLPGGTTSDESGIVTPAGAVMRTCWPLSIFPYCTLSV